MKTINKILGLVLMATVALVSCSRDYDAPPREPIYDGPEANITIKALKEKFSGVLNSSSVGVEYIDTEYIINARLVSSDNEGNVYKQVYVEDETGGINIQVDQSNISTIYPYGQEVYINLHGLYVGQYNGVLQIGGGAEVDPKDSSKKRTTRMTFVQFKKKALKSLWPNPKLVNINRTTIKSIKAKGDDLLCRVVELKNVTFVDGGKLTYAEHEQNTDRILKDANGEEIVVRTSGYASFQATTLPKGKGTVTAILSKYIKSDNTIIWQLVLNSVNDVKGFVEDEGSVDPEPEPEPTEEVNTTIAEFAKKYSAATGDAPIKIEDDIVIGGVVTSDDTAGNIYMKLYLQDETGAISFGISDKAISNSYARGQKLAVNIKGLDAVVYAGVLQIGVASSNANRLSLDQFKSRATVISKDNNVSPLTTTIAALDNSMMNKVVKLENVYFTEGGKLTYSESRKNMNRDLTDGTNKIVVRNSGSSTFYAEMLPEGAISITGLIEKFNEDWQLTIRDLNDVVKGGSVNPPTDSEKPTDPEKPTTPGENIGSGFIETFGNAEKVNNRWPVLSDYTGFDNKNLIFKDIEKNLSVRAQSGISNVWFPKEKDSELEITGIAGVTGKKISLSFDVASNLTGTSSTNLNTLEAWYGDKQLKVTSKVVTGADQNKFYTLTVEGEFDGVDNTPLRFISKVNTNIEGLRLANIKFSVK